MKSVFSVPGLDCSFLSLTYPEWLGIQEPVFFNFMEAREEDYCFSLQSFPSFFSYNSWVKLIRVDDVLYKLNGKQRKDAWLSGKVPPPQHLTAQVFNITETDFLALTAEAKRKELERLGPSDLVKLIYADLGLVFTSERLKSGLITEAMNIALRGRQRSLQDKRSAREREDIDMQKAIALFSKELALIDSLNPKPDIFVTGVLAGVLIMLGLNKPIDGFLERLNMERGERKDDADDPVSGLLRAIHGFSYRMTQKKILQSMSIDLCKRTIQAIVLWEEGVESPKYWRKRELAGVDHLAYINELRRLKRISDQMDL